MKLGNKKSERWGRGWSKKGRKKGCVAEICYNPHYKEFYFLLTKGDYHFNSYWKEMKYNSEEECLIACEEYIDELSKGEKDGRKD